jgi:hypothetical protein
MMGNESILTRERLKSVLHYDRETGLFTWLAQLSGRWAVGRTAGSIRDGYIRIAIDRERYEAHRLAWFYEYGSWPPGMLDHKNGNRQHNCLDNLRPATHSQNNANRRLEKRNELGIKGVSRKKNSYSAQITVRGKSIKLGCYKTPKEAAEAYERAARQYYQEFARVA